MKTPTIAGIAGGAVFLVLNAATDGAVPGGGRGGALGFIIGAGLAYAVTALLSNKSKEDSGQG